MDEGKITVVVTGGTSGIGRAIALLYAAEGATVMVAGRNAAKGAATVEAIDAAGGRGAFVATNVGDQGSVVRFAQETRRRFGAPGILVNSAGLLQSGKRVLDQTMDEHDELWRVNYRGTFLCCQAFGRMMTEAGRGAIANIGSLASLAPLSLPAYTPGKAAILSLTQTLAAELGPFGVRVNAVAPGYTLSDGLKEKIRAGLRDPDAIRATTALGAFVQPDDVAHAVHFLCSERAASITGVMLPVDAGWLVQAPYAAYMRGNPVKD